MLDILVQGRRNAKAAKRFFRKLRKGLQFTPRVIVTDKLRSYAAARRETLPGVEHRQSRYLNNRAEVSPQPTRRRERQMPRFKSAPMRRAFSPPTVGSIITSNSAAILSLPMNIVPPVTPHSTPGGMWRESHLLRDTHIGPRLLALSPTPT